MILYIISFISIVSIVILLLGLNLILNPSKYTKELSSNIMGYVCDKILETCTLTITYEYNGKKYTVADVEAFNKYHNRKIGSKITIYIDPSNPEEISITSQRDNINKGKSLVFFSIILGLLAFYLAKSNNCLISLKA